MEYLRKPADSSELSSLPHESGRGKKPRIKSSKGCLKKYANPALMSEESDAWAKAVVNKAIYCNETNR